MDMDLKRKWNMEAWKVIYDIGVCWMHWTLQLLTLFEKEEGGLITYHHKLLIYVTWKV